METSSVDLDKCVGCGELLAEWARKDGVLCCGRAQCTIKWGEYLQANAKKLAEEEGDLQRFIRESEERDPEFKKARQDSSMRHDILDTLVNRRKTLNISQTVIAEKMEIKQPSVSQFEAESSDPLLSTLQRYARALGGHIRIQFIEDEIPPEATTPKFCTASWNGTPCRLPWSHEQWEHDSNPNEDPKIRGRMRWSPPSK